MPAPGALSPPVAPPEAAGALEPAGPYEYLAPLAAIVSLLAYCVITSNRPFWFDELLTYICVTDPSLSHAVHALGDHVGGGQPPFFVLGWFWVRLFGVSPLALRLLSGLPICLAFWLLWRLLRRRCGFWPATLATAASFDLSLLVQFQMGEARFYGLFLACAALAIWHFDRFLRDDRPPAWLLATNCATHGMLVLIHVYGFTYSGVLILAQVASDLVRRRFRLSVYASALIGWLAFVPWLEAARHQAELHDPWSWIPVPNLNALLVNFAPGGLFAHPLVMLLLVLTVILTGYRRRTAAAPGKTAAAPEIVPSYVILGVLVVVVPPTFGWALSQVIQPVFLERYFIPATAGWAVLAALGLQVLLDWPSGTAVETARQAFISRALCVGLFGVICSNPIVTALNEPALPRPVLADDPLRTPVVVEHLFDYLPLRFYNPANTERLYFVLDWEAALNAQQGIKGATGDYKIAQGLSRNYPEFKASIVTTSEFLGKFDRFLVMPWKGSQWLQMRCPDHDYRYSRTNEGMILVERRHTLKPATD